MNFILGSWVKYYTKEAVKTLKIFTIGSAIIITVACVKYKPAYKVIISGETIGFIENRELMEVKIQTYINDRKGNVAFKEVKAMPEYELKLINKGKETKENDVMLAIQNLTVATYKNYAVTSDGEQKAIVASKEEAENLINEIKNDIQDGVDLKLSIAEVYSTEDNSNSTETAKHVLTEYKIAKVNEYQAQKAEEERIAREKALKNKANRVKVRSIATTATSPASGSLNGLALVIPVNGSISSRFGSRGSSRSSAHTGLDISTSLGTGIRPIAGGTVTYAGYKGSYGNLIIIDHGNGVQSYYAHCNSVYVSRGQGVDTNTTIGAVGSTGNSTGPHLHLEIRINQTPVNPQSYLY